MFNYFSDETEENQHIRLFVAMSAKNYSYETENKEGQLCKRISKIRGLTLTGDILKQMDTQLMLNFVQHLQQEKVAEALIPQYRIKINGSSKKLQSREVASLYSNQSNQKRYFQPKIHPSRMWPYGCTSYE